MQIAHFQGLVEGGNEEKLLNWKENLLWNDGNVLELDRGGGCTTLCKCH